MGKINAKSIIRRVYMQYIGLDTWWKQTQFKANLWSFCVQRTASWFCHSRENGNPVSWVVMDSASSAEWQGRKHIWEYAIWKNKANLFRIEYCVMRIAKRSLKKQSQCQNRQYGISSIIGRIYGYFDGVGRSCAAKIKANLFSFWVRCAACCVRNPKDCVMEFEKTNPICRRANLHKFSNIKGLWGF